MLSVLSDGCVGSQVCFQNSMFLILLGPKILNESTNLRKKEGANEMDVRRKEGGSSIELTDNEQRWAFLSFPFSNILLGTDNMKI